MCGSTNVGCCSIIGCASSFGRAKARGVERQRDAMTTSYARQRVSTSVATKSVRASGSVAGRRPRQAGAGRCAGTRLLAAPQVVEALDDGRDALADADAHGGEAEAAAGPAQFVGQHRDQAAAAHAQRMAEGDGPAVDVDLGRIEAELVHAHERLRGEGLVELDEVEVVDARCRPARAPCATPGSARYP